MPQRETVAGEATARSATSKIMRCRSVSFMISPLERQSFLLSSRTVFMFSIHTASTGPSNTYQRRSESSAAMPPRTRLDRMPSVLPHPPPTTHMYINHDKTHPVLIRIATDHSCVLRSNSP